MVDRDLCGLEAANYILGMPFNCRAMDTFY